MENNNIQEHKILTWPLRIAFAICILGLLAKLMFWPFNNIAINAGCALLFCLYPFRFAKKNNKKFLDYVKLVMVASGTILIVLQFNHLPYVFIFQFLTIVTYSIWFIFEGYGYFSGTQSANEKKINTALLVIASAGVIVGLIFKIQHWQGAQILIICGLVIGLILFVKDMVK
jgi:hypothetical protein